MASTESKPLERFQDPKADLVLSSADGVTCRVHSYVLRANSTVLADMMTVPPPADLQDAQPITIDLSSRLLQVFLELLHNNVVVSRSYAPEEWLDVIRICDTFGCLIAKERLGKLLLRTIQVLSTVCAELYIVASHLDDIYLAHAVLSAISIKSLRDLLRDRGQHAQIPARYTYPLLTALIWHDDGETFNWEKWRLRALENVKKIRSAGSSA